MKEEGVPECRRCGACCLPGVFTLMKEDDIRRWKDQGRGDILRIIEEFGPVWAGDRMVSLHGANVKGGCVFLERGPGGCFCRIYETRPGVCRNFTPGLSLFCPLHGGRCAPEKPVP